MRVVLALLASACSFHHGIAPGGSAGDDAGDDASDAGLPPDWWNPAWHARMPLTILDGAALPLPAGYQVGFALDLDAPPCLPGDRDQIRIVRAGSDLDRVIDEVGTAEWTWFPLQAAIAPGAMATDYWLYCDDPDPSPAPSDPTAVFDFYDGFDAATVDTSVWTVQNTVSVSDGLLVCGGGGLGDNGVVTKTRTFGANHAVDFIAISGTATAADFWAGFQIGTMDVAPWLHWWTKDASSICPDYLGVATDSPWYGTDVSLDTAPHLYGVENYGDASAYRLADAIVQSHVYAPMQPPPAQVDVRLWDGDATAIVSYDMVRVRQAVNPPPAVTVGPAESY